MLYRYFNNWYCSFFLTEKIPGGETPLRLPYRHWSETRENELSLVWNSVRIWRSRRHNPTVNSQEYPPSPGEKIFCQLGLPWAAWSINSYKSWSLIACLQSILCSQHPLRAYGMPTPHAGFRAEKRSAQASAHPLPQAQGGLFWLCLFVAGVLSEMHEVRTFAPCKAFLLHIFFFVAWKLLWIQNNQC